MSPQTSGRTLSLIVPERAPNAFKIRSLYDATLREDASRPPCAAHADLAETMIMAVDQSPASIMLSDLDGRIQYVNRRFTDFTGYTPAEAIGQNALMLESGSNPPALYAELWKTVLGGNVWRGEIENRKKNGERYWASASVSPICDSNGVVTHFLGSHEDVTARRESEQDLRASEAKFRLLTEASFDAVLIAVDGLILESNFGLPNMLGYTIDEVIGRPVLDFVAEESHALVESRMREEIVGIYEFVGKHRNGRKLVLEAAARNHRINGQAARLTAVRDITERRNLENQFRQAQKMEAVGRLAGGVAHDFNNLLTVIMAYTQMIEDELGPASPLLEDLDEIQKAATAAATLTKQLLAFSRKQVIEPKLVFLEEVVGSAENMLRRLIGEDVELATKFSDVPCPVILDPGQLDQVIMNLAVNARDAMPLGGKLTLETAIVDLDADYAIGHWPAVAGRFAMLAVSDSGMGMSAETQARIFEPFFTTKEIGKGTGLGLATVYGIVKQSNGFIWVYSEVEHGTTFKLYFPIASNTERAEPACKEAGHHDGTETVLIVEDSPSVRSAARRILQRCGYKVLEAPNGKAGLALAKKKHLKIDLLVTDVIMPEMSGREVAATFAKLRPDTKVLYMSGYTDDAIVRHGILQEGIAYLQKPFTGVTLAARVREVLNVSCDGPPVTD